MVPQSTARIVRGLCSGVLVLCLAGEAIADGLDGLTAPGAAAHKVAGDCRFTEGPAWSPKGYLLFSDIPNERIVKLLPDGSLEDFLKPSQRANGLMFDQAGRLYACQGAGRVVRIDVEEEKNVSVLAAEYDGKKLNSPNDLSLDYNGGLYFTDPSYGQGNSEQPVMGVYYIDAGGKVTRVIDDLERPNGILVSPDGKRLHVAEPNKREIYRWDIDAPGKLSGKKRVFTGDQDLDGGGPDGMAHDERGNIYATYKGIVVLDPEGKLLGRIGVPERPANCAFGGPEGKPRLYITARTSLYAVDMKVRGAPLAKSGPGGGARTSSGAKTRPVKAGSLALEVPESWKQIEPTSGFSSRLAQFEIAAAEGDPEPAELAVFHFGAGGAGGVRANVQRWIGQFAPAKREVKVTAGKCPAGEYTVVDATGTFLKPIGPPIQGKTKPLPGARMLAAIVQTPDGSYFLKLTGPEKTVSGAAAAFRASLGADGSAEKPLDLGGGE